MSQIRLFAPRGDDHDHHDDRHHRLHHHNNITSCCFQARVFKYLVDELARLCMIYPSFWYDLGRLER